MHQSHIPNAPSCNRNVHRCTFLVHNGALWDICLLHCGIHVRWVYHRGSSLIDDHVSYTRSNEDFLFVFIYQETYRMCISWFSPGWIIINKSSLALPATTRTDLEVIDVLDEPVEVCLHLVCPWLQPDQLFLQLSNLLHRDLHLVVEQDRVLLALPHGAVLTLPLFCNLREVIVEEGVVSAVETHPSGEDLEVIMDMFVYLFLSLLSHVWFNFRLHSILSTNCSFRHKFLPWRQFAMETLKVRSHMRGAEADGKLASTEITTCVHTYAVAERRRSGSKIRSATNGSNTQFSASASKPRAPNHLRPQEMADPPASVPRICEYTRSSGAGMLKSARLRSATAPRICERSLTDALWWESTGYRLFPS